VLSLKRLTSVPWVQKAIGVAAAEYLRAVWRTSRMVIDPPDIYDAIERELPVIIAMWHGQHFLMPFVKLEKESHRAKVLVSRHRDGAINAIAAERLGIGTIRGSGDHGGAFMRKGGVYAFREMLAALEAGYNVALTADVPKVARVCGLGIVKLASVSGRMILPVALATDRRIELKSWDRSTINLPFSRGAGVVGKPIRVPPDADEAALEQARRAVQAELDAVTARAYEIADGIRRQRAAG